MAINKVDFAIGEVIRLQRRCSEMDQKELAKEMGISQSSLSRKESGKESLSVSQLFQIGCIFDVYPQDLVKLAITILKESKFN